MIQLDGRRTGGKPLTRFGVAGLSLWPGEDWVGAPSGPGKVIPCIENS